MAIKRIPIDKASAAQLAAFATLNLGLDVPGDASAAKLRGQVAAAGYDKDFIEIDADEAPAQVQPRATAQMQAPLTASKPTKVRIQIHRQSGPGGDEPVFVSVNGSAMWVPRGDEVEIPAHFYEALKNATTYQYEPNDATGLKTPREVPAYPFSVLGMN